MAKRIRAARHYQRKDAAIRLLAEHAKPAIRRELRQAFSHLGSLVPTDQVLHFARAADWFNLKRAIHWNHYREVLKAPFGRIVKLRQSGAELGVQKINGVFAQARRRVRFAKGGLDSRWWVTKAGHDVSDEPRDERGRWTTGGGGNVASPDQELAQVVGLFPEMRALYDTLSGAEQDAVGEFMQAVRAAGAKREMTITQDGRVSQRGGAVDQNETHAANSTEGAILTTAWIEVDQALNRALKEIPLIEHIPGLSSAITLVRRIAELRRISKSLDGLFAKDIGDRFNFDVLDRATQDKIRAAQDELIQQLEKDARDTIDTIIMNGAREGLGAEAIVEDIRDMIGLTARQGQAVMNYESMLRDLDPGALTRQLRNKEFDAVFEDAIDSGMDLSEAAIAGMVDDYISNYLDYRAETIARTESTRAANAGLEDGYQQAIDRGALPEDAVKRFWQLADHPCVVCESVVDMNPDGVDVGEDFDSIDGPQDLPPIHPSCQCSIEYVTDLDKVPDDPMATEQ